MAVEKPGKLREFFLLLLCGHPVRSGQGRGQIWVEIIAFTKYLVFYNKSQIKST